MVWSISLKVKKPNRIHFILYQAHKILSDWLKIYQMYLTSKMNTFCVLAFLFLASTVVDAQKDKNYVFKVADLNACMKRKNALIDEVECKFYCLAELTNWIKDNKLNMGKVKEYYAKTPKVATDIETKCGSIKPTENCQWASEVYDCSQKIPEAKLPAKRALFSKVKEVSSGRSVKLV